MNEKVETETQPNGSADLTVQVKLRPWRVCAGCGHAWKSRATRGRPRCRDCETRLRNEAETASAVLGGGLRR
jgi:tRNA(Ile2) C34 agmatinyltransferase TiaS